MRIDDITFSYDNKEIFQSASVTFTPGVNLILGPSGCGKTTLLKIIAGVLRVPHIRFDRTRARCLLVLQEDALIPWLTGWDNLFVFLREKISRDEILAHTAFGLMDGFISEKAWRMSFGQRRTIEIFRAILARPDILCLDEPLNFLDPARREVLAHLIAGQTDGQHTLISTHEPEDFQGLASNCVRFDGCFPITRLFDCRVDHTPLSVARQL